MKYLAYGIIDEWGLGFRAQDAEKKNLGKRV
jgi:hypothetical protein